MQDTTAVLISFLRPEYTIECVKSLREQYAGIKILVADNAEYNAKLNAKLKEYDAKYILMPFDSGVCFARNRLVELVDTKFVLVGDDDFYYTETAKVKEMRNLLKANKEFTLIGGRISEKGKVLDYQGDIGIFPDHLEYTSLKIKECKKDRKSGLLYKKCDITFNFFIARADEIRDIKWDEKIKVAFEHSDWFISLKKAGRAVAFTPDAIVVHKPEHVKLDQAQIRKYSAFRMRRSDQTRFFTKHHLKYSLGFRGLRTSFAEVKREAKTYHAKVAFSQDGKAYNKGDIIKLLPGQKINDNMEPLY